MARKTIEQIVDAHPALSRNAVLAAIASARGFCARTWYIQIPSSPHDLLVANETVERQIVERLRREGHQVRYEAEDRGGAPDESVLADAASGAATLVTTDKDFGELVFRLRKASHRVILLRLAGLSNELKAELEGWREAPGWRERTPLAGEVLRGGTQMPVRSFSLFPSAAHATRRAGAEPARGCGFLAIRTDFTSRLTPLCRWS